MCIRDRSTLVLFQCFFIYVTFQASALISETTPIFSQGRAISAAQDLYKKKREFRENWNIIQSDLRCCGFNSWADWSIMALTDAEHRNLTQSACYPKSCCTQTFDQCTDTHCYKNWQEISGDVDEINLRGCNHVLQEFYQEKLPSVFTFTELMGTINILVEVATIALASGLVGQITRKLKGRISV